MRWTINRLDSDGGQAFVLSGAACCEESYKADRLEGDLLVSQAWLRGHSLTVVWTITCDPANFRRSQISRFWIPFSLSLPASPRLFSPPLCLDDSIFSTDEKR